MSAIEQLPQMLIAMKEIVRLAQELAESETLPVEPEAAKFLRGMANMAESMAEFMADIAAGDETYREVTIVMDFRNPLIAMNGYSDLLQMYPEWNLEPTHQAKIEQIDALTGKLMDWYRAVSDDYRARHSDNSSDLQ